MGGRWGEVELNCKVNNNKKKKDLQGGSKRAAGRAACRRWWADVGSGGGARRAAGRAAGVNWWRWAPLRGGGEVLSLEKGIVCGPTATELWLSHAKMANKKKEKKDGLFRHY